LFIPELPHGQDMAASGSPAVRCVSKTQYRRGGEGFNGHTNRGRVRWDSAGPGARAVHPIMGPAGFDGEVSLPRCTSRSGAGSAAASVQRTKTTFRLADPGGITVHVAHPLGEARILVIESEGNV
jgi:hypothetical protein